MMVFFSKRTSQILGIFTLLDFQTEGSVLLTVLCVNNCFRKQFKIMDWSIFEGTAGSFMG